MKRLLWCLCLCSLCPTLVIGCGDDETSSASEDGGVEQDLREVTDAINNVRDDLDGLTENVDGLNEDVDGLDERLNDIDELNELIDGRLEDLENPEILSCSESEVCIPDGIDLSTEGIDDIIAVICEHEVDCCSEAELNFKFGPGIETADQCRELFTDIVENGFSPSFLDASLAPSVVFQIIGVAQALNDPRVRVEIDADGVQECVESLQLECPEIPEPGEPAEPECYASPEYEEDPCSLDNLLNGLQDDGELCGLYAYGGGEGGGEVIPECKDGSYCSFEGYSSAVQGICTKLPENGDFCQEDEDCDPFADSYNNYWGGPQVTYLYCNIASAQCEPLGAVGDPCDFIDDTFTITDESGYLDPSDRSSTSRDCRNGLTCDPTSNECVDNCSRGRFCYPGADPFSTCGEDFLCNVTEEPKLYENHYLGICWPALERGDSCTEGFECEGGKCTEDCNQDTGLCECNEVLAPGEECDTPGPDDLCSSGWCGTNGECADTCNCDANVEGSCDAGVEGPAGVACDDGYYCNWGQYDSNGLMYVCEPLIANGSVCDYTDGEDQHVPCNSGFCNTSLGQCAAKVAVDDPCPTGLDQQCRNTQYCNNEATMLCRTYRTAGQTCDAAVECADGLVCVDGTASDTCQPLAQPGEVCNAGNVGAPQCDTSEDSLIECVDIDGGRAGLVYECYSPQSGYADTVECGGNDALCASGWCRPDAATAPVEQTCEQPLPEGDACDTNNPTIDVCAEGLFCKRTRSSTAGTCAEQSGPGEPCDPFFGNGGCRFGGQCVFTKDQYLCDDTSIEYGVEVFCGG